jgi:hypothetical protein
MTANQASLRASAGAQRCSLIERRLRRYSCAAQPRVRALADRHPRLADLAVSFPPLLFALALPRPGENPELAIACAIQGRPLNAVAAAAGVPRWLRRLPVDGLTRPLPRLPTSELFGRRIVNYVPRSPKLTTAWLELVADAAQWGSEPFAVWIAREIARDVKVLKADKLRLLAIWTWFSQQPQTSGFRLMETPWHSEMRFDPAIGAARAWYERLVLELGLGEWQIADPWLRPGPFDGHDFVPLDSAERLADEAAAMENCLATYCYDVVDDHCRLWSIRREGRRIASFEVRRHPRRPLLHIEQLSGMRNEVAPIEIWWLATRWLQQHDLPSIRPEPCSRAPGEPDMAAWRKLWRPYWLAKRRIPSWLPLRPSWNAFYVLGEAPRRRRRRGGRRRNRR